MLILGVTGSIGSGKTTVARMLAERGGILSHSDDLAKELINTDPELRSEIKLQFGADVYDASGVLNRSILAQRAFASSKTQIQLNRLVHPAVRRHTLERIRLAEEAGERLFIVDAPLLFEAGVDAITDRVLVVTAPELERARRVYVRSRLSQTEFQQRDQLQMTQDEKVKRADDVIHNDGSLETLKERVNAYYQSLNL